MSQPVLSGEELAVAVEAGQLRITNDPGFTSENGDGCPYRAVLIRSTGLVAWYGAEVPARTLPDYRWTGFYETREALAAARMPAPPAGFCRVYAGTYFKGWGDEPQDWLEWGYTDQGKNPSGLTRVNEVAFTSEPSPPPPPSLAKQALEHFNASTVGYVALTKWAAANPGEYARLSKNDYDVSHYATRFGKFLATLRQAAQA